MDNKDEFDFHQPNRATILKSMMQQKIGDGTSEIMATVLSTEQNNDDYGINYNIQHHLLQGNTKHYKLPSS